MSLLEKLDPTGRFSSRVRDYERYRPSYPALLLDWFAENVGDLKSTTVADVGSGTGILSGLFLERGSTVYAIEPNEKMRHSAESRYSHDPQFHSRDGTAEATGMISSSVDLITCAQAFHWFDPDRARLEFDRILKPEARVALIWNDGREESGFGAAYREAKRKYGGEAFENVRSISVGMDKTFVKFFGERGFQSVHFENEQLLDQDGLIGRFFSSSYAPTGEDPSYPDAVASLKKIFQDFQKNGVVRIEYFTQLYFGY